MKTIQPVLFDLDVYTVSDAEIRRSGRSIIEKLLRMRRMLSPGEKKYLLQINECIEKIRAIHRLTDNQREELVLYSIERQGASTLIEVVEDTRIDRKTVEAIIDDLITREKIYDSSRKYIPGSGRPNYILKSRRVKLPDAM